MTVDVVFTFSLETLADSVERGMARPPGRMLQTLSRHDDVGALMVVDGRRWFPSILRRPRSPWPDALGAPRPHVRPWRVGRREPTTTTEVERDIHRRQDQLRRAATRAGLDQPAIITFDPLLAGFGRFEWAGPVTYYARDDWASYPARTAWWPAYERAYELLRERARGVLAVSAPLLERIAPTGPAAVIPNGIEPDEWRRPGAAPDWMNSLEGPVMTYLGTIDTRVDMALIERIATRPGTVVLVGPCPDDGQRRRLDEMGAVVHHASSRAEIAAIAWHSDVGLIPHAQTDLTEAMSPLKLYEYRAAGLPVATIDLPPIRTEAAADPRIVIAERGADGYADAIDRALEIGRDADDARLQYIDETAWSARHRVALEIAFR